MDKDIVIIYSNNQEDIYIKGKLWEQGVSIGGESTFKLGQLFPHISYSDIKKYYLSASQMQKLDWKLPENLSEIPEAFLK